MVCALPWHQQLEEDWRGSPNPNPIQTDPFSPRRMPSGLSKQLAGFVQFPPQQRWDNEALDHCLAMTWLFLQPPEAFDHDNTPTLASAAVERTTYADPAAIRLCWLRDVLLHNSSLYSLQACMHVQLVRLVHAGGDGCDDAGTRLPARAERGGLLGPVAAVPLCRLAQPSF